MVSSWGWTGMLLEKVKAIKSRTWKPWAVELLSNLVRSMSSDQTFWDVAYVIKRSSCHEDGFITCNDLVRHFETMRHYITQYCTVES